MSHTPDSKELKPSHFAPEIRQLAYAMESMSHTPNNEELYKILGFGNAARIEGTRRVELFDRIRELIHQHDNQLRTKLLESLPEKKAIGIPVEMHECDIVMWGLVSRANGHNEAVDLFEQAISAVLGEEAARVVKFPTPEAIARLNRDLDAHMRDMPTNQPEPSLLQTMDEQLRSNYELARAATETEEGRKAIDFFYHVHLSGFTDRIAVRFAQDKAQAVAEADRRHNHELAILRADIAAAMGHMEGCGHQYEYLRMRYPEFAQLEAGGEG